MNRVTEKFKVICADCGTIQSNSYAPACEKCGGLTEAVFDLDKVEIKESDNPYERYFDLIPVLDSGLLPKNITMTPVIHAKKLGKLLGLPELYLKNETANLTGTTKYRMAAVSLPFLYESGVREFCTSSTGNSSTAYANLIDMIPELKMHLFTADEFQKRVNYNSIPQIKHYILHGASFAEASEIAGDFAKKFSCTAERGFFNLGRREGLKLVWYESVEQIGAPIDWYVQAVSSGMGVYGVYKAAKEFKELGLIDRLPRLMCVQQNSCSPMAAAWMENEENIQEKHIVHHPNGLAKAILRGNPSRVYPYMRKIVNESKGSFVAVSDEEIMEAKKLIFELEGIDICYSSATAVAGLIQSVRKNEIDKNDRFLINLTGSDRKNGNVPEDAIHLYRKRKNEWSRS